MFEFLYTLFLLRFSSQLLTRAIKTPQAFGNVLSVFGYVLIAFCVISIYAMFGEKQIDNQKIMGFLLFLCINGILSSINIWAGKILEQVKQEKYDKLYTFKAIGRGFLGVAAFFAFFASINLIVGAIWLMGLLVWIILLIGSLGTILLSKDNYFENFVYLPTLFFKTETALFTYLGMDALAFGIVLGLVVLLLPFFLSLWIIFQKKKLLE